MRKAFAFLAVALFALAATAGDRITWTVTSVTNAATTVTGYANPFTGEIDEIVVYSDAGVTGAESIVALDPFSGNALVLATNAAATVQTVWTPRVLAAAYGGSTALTVTNTATADRPRIYGERVFATVRPASSTATVFRVTIKTR